MENGGAAGIHYPDWMFSRYIYQQLNLLTMLIRSRTDAHLLPLHHHPPPAAAPASPRGVRGYCHGAMKHAVPFLLVPVALKYQGKPDILFHQYAAYFWCSLVSTCIYWLMLQPLKQMLEADAGHRFNKLLTGAEFAFALLSISSLLSVILPHHIAWLPLVLWTLVCLVLAWPLYSCGYTSVCSGIDVIFKWVSGFFEPGGGNSSSSLGSGV